MSSIDSYRALIKKDIELIESHLNSYGLNKLDIEIAIGFIKSETGKTKETGYKQSVQYLNLAMPNNTFLSALTLCKKRTPEFKSLRDKNYVSYKHQHDDKNFRDIPLSTSLILTSLAIHVFNANNPDITGFKSLHKNHELSKLTDSVKERDLIVTASKLRLPRELFDSFIDNGIDYNIIVKQINERVEKQRLTQPLKESNWTERYLNNPEYAKKINFMIDELVYKLS